MCQISYNRQCFDANRAPKTKQNAFLPSLLRREARPPRLRRGLGQGMNLLISIVPDETTAIFQIILPAPLCPVKCEAISLGRSLFNWGRSK
jgi:hypothetical protein